MGDEGFASRLWGGMRRAYGADEGPTTEFLGRLRTGLGRAYGQPDRFAPFAPWARQRGGFRGRGATASWEPMPSRGAVREAVEGPRDRDKRLREDYAATQAARETRGEDPRNVRTQTEASAVPTDDKRVKVGTGTVDDKGEPSASSYGDYHVVRFPDGRVVVTPTPEGETAEGGRRDPAAGRANVVSGAAGTVYSSPEAARLGPGGADLGQTELPGRDRSPGWAARAAINEAFRAGELSMDPRDIMDRRRFEEMETARDAARERFEVEHEASLRAAMMPPVDPYLMAEIEAQGRYGARGLQEQMTNDRIMGALALYTQISGQIRAVEEQMNALDPESVQYQALAQQRDRLIQDRREMPNLALGFSLRDPKLDPFTAMLGFMGAQRAGTEEGT